MFFVTGQGVFAAATTPLKSSAVLVQYRNGTDLDEFEREDAGAYPEGDSRWSTAWTDGRTFKTKPGLFILKGKQLYSVIPKWATAHKGSKAYLSLKPIDGGKPIRIWEAESDDYRGAPYDKQGWGYVQISVVSVCGDMLGLSIWTGNGIRSNDDRNFGMWKIANKLSYDGEVKGFEVSKDDLKKANEKLMHLDGDEQATSDDTVSDTSRIIVAPHKTGWAAEFAEFSDPTSPFFLYIRVPVKSKRLDAFSVTPDYAKKQFGLPPSAYDVLNVSPDKTSVVFAKSHMLYWKTGTAKAHMLGQVGDIRGFQWLPAGTEVLH
jgi:hypothetical protein